MKKVIAVIVWFILLVALVGGIVMIYRYTNGFNEDFKTFYIERDGTKILTETGTATFEAGSEVRYGVGYTFDLPKSETREYSVSILPNPEADFDFTVNGVTTSWRKVEGLERCFALDKRADGFTLKIPSYNSIADYLREIYAGSEIDISGAFTEGAEGEISFFLLRVSSYNDAVKYDIAFCVLSSVTGYSITFSSVPGGNGWMTKIVCPTRAEAGEVVSFSWEWSGESPYQDLQSVTVKTESGTSVEWFWAADYSSRQFTMPAENVTILVTYGHSVHGG